MLMVGNIPINLHVAGGLHLFHLEARAGSPLFMAEPSDGENGFSAEYIEGFYNTRRRHSALGHLSPSEYEEVRLEGGAVA
jgi:transposase InsO family protein